MAIFCVRLPRQTLLLQMSSLWTNIKSTDIHQSIETNSEFSTESGNKDGSISGRFVNHGFIQRRAIKAFKFPDDMLNKHGFTINAEKSCLKPSQVINYLGFQINSRLMTLKLPKQKLHDLI